MSAADPTIRDRKQRHKANNIQQGLVQVQVWIPKDKRDDLHQLASRWRKAHDNQTTWNRRMSANIRNS